MHLSRVDLNLFTVFDAIYREGGITPASKRLHLSQPAVSHALARLRELLDDPLFERQGNEMIATPRARALAETIARSLGGIEQVLHRLGHFSPAESQRSFTIALRESSESLFVPTLVARLAREAPHVGLATVRIERRDLEDDLHDGDLDAAIDVSLPLSGDVRTERVRSESLVVMARADHPTIRGQCDLGTYLAAEHVLVTGRRRGGGYEDIALGRLGLSRRIRVRCQLHGAASRIVSESDLIATMTRGHAEPANLHTRNQVLLFPADIPPLETYLYWHANVDDDPANRWLREMILEVMRR
jgi:DNA-binding transcriptional LysR family regulator